MSLYEPVALSKLKPTNLHHLFSLASDNSTTALGLASVWVEATRPTSKCSPSPSAGSSYCTSC